MTRLAILLLLLTLGAWATAPADWYQNELVPKPDKSRLRVAKVSTAAALVPPDPALATTETVDYYEPAPVLVVKETTLKIAFTSAPDPTVRYYVVRGSTNVLDPKPWPEVCKLVPTFKRTGTETNSITTTSDKLFLYVTSANEFGREAVVK